MNNPQYHKRISATPIEIDGQQYVRAELLKEARIQRNELEQANIKLKQQNEELRHQNFILRNPVAKP